MDKKKTKTPGLTAHAFVIVKNEKWNFFSVYFLLLTAGAAVVALMPSFFITEEVTSLLSVSLMKMPAC